MLEGCYNLGRFKAHLQLQNLRVKAVVIGRVYERHGTPLDSLPTAAYKVIGLIDGSTERLPVKSIFGTFCGLGVSRGLCICLKEIVVVDEHDASGAQKQPKELLKLSETVLR